MKSVKKAQAGMKVTKKTPLGSKSVGRYDLEKNPGEAGKNFGKSSQGPKVKVAKVTAKNGKAMKGKCKNGC